jgi:hypothetical protein
MTTSTVFVDHTYRYRTVEQQSAFLLQHRRQAAKISAGGTSEKGDDMIVGSKRAVAGLVGSIVGMIALVLFPAAAVADPTGAQATLTGTGSGRVLIAPTAKLHGSFAVQVTVNVHRAIPDTTYTVTRYPDLDANGICTGQVPRITGPLTTSHGGAGAAHFYLEPPGFVSGTSFDVVWVLVGSDGSELVSDCVTVTVE